MTSLTFPGIHLLSSFISKNLGLELDLLVFKILKWLVVGFQTFLRPNNCFLALFFFFFKCSILFSGTRYRLWRSLSLAEYKLHHIIVEVILVTSCLNNILCSLQNVGDEVSWWLQGVITQQDETLAVQYSVVLVPSLAWPPLWNVVLCSFFFYYIWRLLVNMILVCLCLHSLKLIKKLMTS